MFRTIRRVSPVSKSFLAVLVAAAALGVARPGAITAQGRAASPHGAVAAGHATHSVEAGALDPNLSIGDATVQEGNNGITNLVFTVTLSGASGQAISVAYATANATATAGSDYTAASGTLNFAPGDLTHDITVPVSGDTQFEADESLLVNLSAPVNANITAAHGLGTIVNDDSAGTLAIGDATTLEGNTGTSNAVFTVSLSQPAGQPVSVDYASADGTAVAGTDYVAVNGTIVFAPGQVTKTIDVVINGDLQVESDEIYTVNLTAASGAVIAAAHGLGTISNDDAPDLTIADASLAEGNSGPSTALFVVSLSQASAQPVTVDYATANGTAVALPDYTPATGTLTFAPGELSKTIAVTINGDTTNETDEQFVVNLGNPTGATVSDGQGTGTIVNDDAVPLLSISDVNRPEGTTSFSSSVFVVSLSARSEQTVTVNYFTSPLTASVGSDFNYTSGTLTFAPGALTQIIQVPVFNDSLFEPDEYFQVTLTAPVNSGLADAVGYGGILNDDNAGSFSVNDGGLYEGNSGTNYVHCWVYLQPAAGIATTVNYATANGSALAGSDYQYTSGTLSFAPGEFAKSISVPVYGDTVAESDEFFFLNLTSANGAGINDGQAICTILNDDLTPTFTVYDETIVEGDSGTSNAVFTVGLLGTSSQTSTVQFATADNTAVGGTDYTPVAGTLTFAPGDWVKTISVLVLGDILNEPDEKFFVNLSNAANATIADAQGIGTIVNDDTAGTLAVGDATLQEGDTGSANMQFAVTLSAASTQSVTVDYATGDATALAGSDYAATAGTLTFAPGEVTKAISVAVTGDTLNEADETFTVQLSGATVATLSDATGIGTIVNDDNQPRLSIADATVTEGNSGTTNAIFTVSLSAASGQSVTVHGDTIDAMAMAPVDYVATSTVLVFAPGEVSKQFVVPVKGDIFDEPSEYFLVHLTAPVNAVLNGFEAFGTITNDDGEPDRISVSGASVTEGNSGNVNAVFTVSLLSANQQTVTVHYTTIDGTAVSTSDYSATSGTLTFAPGIVSHTVSVAVHGDTLNEANETFQLKLSSPTNAFIYGGEDIGIGTIVNDDRFSVLGVGDATLLEGKIANNLILFPVTLTPASGTAVRVDYATLDGTAHTGSDFEATHGTLTFEPGETTKTISVSIMGDNVREPDESFSLRLSAPVNATLGRSEATGTIVNDDDTVGPISVKIIGPASGAVISTLPACTGSAADDEGGVGLQRVDLYLRRSIDGVWFTGTKWGTTTPVALATMLNADGTWSRSMGLPMVGSTNEAMLLSDGMYDLHAYAYDKVGNLTTATSVFQVQAPNSARLAITAPRQNSIVTSLPVLSARTNDTAGGPRTVKVDFYLRRGSDAKWWGGNMWGSTAMPLPSVAGTLGTWLRSNGLPMPTATDMAKKLTDGNYLVYAWATDSTGKVTTVSLPFSVRNQITVTTTITAPAKNAKVMSLPALSATTTDSLGGGGVAKVEFYLRRGSDGKWWDGNMWASAVTALPCVAGPGGTWMRTTGLPMATPTGPDNSRLTDGAYLVYAWTTDLNGKVTTVSSPFTVATSGPVQVMVTVPVANATVNALPAITAHTVDGSGGNAVTRVDVYLRRGSDGKWWDGTGGWGTAVTPLSTVGSGNDWTRSSGLPTGGGPAGPLLPDGPYLAYAWAYDSHGKVVTASTPFTVQQVQTAAAGPVRAPATPNAPGVPGDGDEAGAGAGEASPSHLQLSAVTADSSSGMVSLLFTGRLDVNSACDPGHYHIRIDGTELSAESYALRAAGAQVQLAMPEGSLRAGARVTVEYRLTDSQGGALHGNASAVAR